MKRTLLLVLLGAYALLAGSAPAHAYDDDTHYYYCYYLARKCGFGPQDSLRIASANVAVDYCPVTEPLQNYSPGPGAQTVRERFHSLPPFTGLPKFVQKWTPTDRENVQKWLTQRENQAWAMGNPGVFLHYYMDRFAHENYHSPFGHFFDPTANLGARIHKPDYLSDDVAKAMKMTRGTITVLLQFKAKQRANLTLDGIPYLKTTEENNRRKQIYDTAYEMLKQLTRTVNQKPDSFNSPNSADAKRVIEKALNEKIPDVNIKVGGEADHRIDYQFDLDGKVTANADKWALTGR